MDSKINISSVMWVFQESNKGCQEQLPLTGLRTVYDTPGENA